MKHNQACTHVVMWRSYKTAVPVRDFGGRCQQGGAREFGLEAKPHIVSNDKCISYPPMAYVWHDRRPVSGTISLYHRCLALSLTFPPTAFQQLD